MKSISIHHLLSVYRLLQNSPEQISVCLLQRHLRTAYSETLQLLEAMQKLGWISVTLNDGKKIYQVNRLFLISPTRGQVLDTLH